MRKHLSPPSEKKEGERVIPMKRRNMTKIYDKNQKPKAPSSHENTKSHRESVSDAKTLAEFLETLNIPNDVKDIVFSSLKYVIKRTKYLNRRMT
jgi:hypothetical protein